MAASRIRKRSISWACLCLAWAGVPSASARAELLPFTGELAIEASVATELGATQLVTVQATGVAEVDGGVVRLPAGAFTAMVAGLPGFGGTLTSGPATFSPGGAGPGTPCPSTAIQFACIDGAGFGGAAALEGVTHLGQPLEVFGLGGTHVGMTASGVPRVEEAERWTTGHAEAYFIVQEVDPGTPFLIEGTGTFRGLPGTFTGTGPAGFTVVTPMVVTADLPDSSRNVRAIARLRIDFGARPVPLAGSAVVAVVLAALGAARLGQVSRSRTARPHARDGRAARPQ